MQKRRGHWPRRFNNPVRWPLENTVGAKIVNMFSRFSPARGRLALANWNDKGDGEMTIYDGRYRRLLERWMIRGGYVAEVRRGKAAEQ